VEHADERGLLDEEVVDEELPADVDRNDGRRRSEIRRRRQMRWERTADGRPGICERDPVVQYRACRDGRVRLWRAEGQSECGGGRGLEERAALDAARP
jgi:hypothetical protein